jgi:hypothetical protein
LLTDSKKPFLILGYDLPKDDLLNLIQQKEAAFGLILKENADPWEYVKILDKAIQKVGTSSLMIVPEASIMEKTGKNQLLRLMSAILKSGHKGIDVYNLFSGTLFRILSKVKGEKEPLIYAPIPL